MDNLNDKEIDDKLLNKLELSSYSGLYISNQFYFLINTRKTRQEAGLKIHQRQIDAEQQRRLQAENLPTLFHEYFHFIHETSTMAGLSCMLANIRMKSAFLHWLNPDLNDPESLGCTANPGMVPYFIDSLNLINIIDGDRSEVANRRKISKVLSMDCVTQEAVFPAPNNAVDKHQLLIPKITFQYIDLDKGSEGIDYLIFGRFFLYEGLAYELDREIDAKVRVLSEIDDKAKWTEYTVLRLLAEFIFPQITKKTYLSLAVIALQGRDCGNTFVQLVQQMKSICASGKSQENTLIGLKSDISIQMLSMQADFNINQDSIFDYFKGRTQLYEGYSYLAGVIKDNFAARIKNPCFEVDMVLDGNFTDILNISPVCDYIYEFKDSLDLHRDFIGTTIDQEISQAMKTLATFDHYFRSHLFKTTSEVEKTDHCCPFYYCCEFERRMTDAGDCYSKPWRIFEKDRASTQQYCWYGQGVGNAKGHTIKGHGK